MSECLIIPCSARKVHFEVPTAAIQVFDGVLARVIRKRSPGLPVYIMSAKYGLIHKNDLIEEYEISPEAVLCRDYVVEKVIGNWLKITDGKPDMYDTIWHITRGASFQAIQILGKWCTMKHVLPEDMPMRHNVGVMLRELKAFCIARPTYSDIDLDHLVAMYEQAKTEGKI